MATPAQIGIGAGAIAAVSLGGYAIYTVTTSEGEEIKPITFTISDIEKFSDQDYKGKLISLIKKENLQHWVKPNEEKNKKWWEGIFKDKYKSKPNNSALDSIFSNLELAYSKEANSKSLNHACDSAYKQEKTKYTFTSSNLLKNIADFCTNVIDNLGVVEPSATTHETDNNLTSNYEWGVLKKEKNRKHLVKKLTTDTNNWWWEWAYHNLYKDKNKDASDHFKNITKGFSSDSTKTLSKQCDEAYKKEHGDLKGTDAKNKLLNEIAKYCSVNLLSLTLELPEKDTEPNKKHLLTINSDSSTYSGGVAKETSNNQKLVDPDNAENKDWWNWAYRNRYKKRESNFVLHSDFQSLDMGYDATNAKALNQVCKKTYSKKKNEFESGNEKLLDNIKQFCAKEKTESISKPNS